MRMRKRLALSHPPRNRKLVRHAASCQSQRAFEPCHSFRRTPKQKERYFVSLCICHLSFSCVGPHISLRDWIVRKLIRTVSVKKKKMHWENTVNSLSSIVWRNSMEKLLNEPLYDVTMTRRPYLETSIRRVPLVTLDETRRYLRSAHDSSGLDSGIWLYLIREKEETGGKRREKEGKWGKRREKEGKGGKGCIK
jgi:hypothetical protein